MKKYPSGKSFYMLFNCLTGGVIEPIKLATSQIKDDRSIILIDEETRTVWLWHGKAQGLVQRRTALRQANSLKGHGYQSEDIIVGRSLKTLKEIDARKVNHVPEHTKMNENFHKIMSKNFSHIGNLVYIEGEKAGEDIESTDKVTAENTSVVERKKEEPKQKSEVGVKEGSRVRIKEKPEEMPQDKLRKQGKTFEGKVQEAGTKSKRQIRIEPREKTLKRRNEIIPKHRKKEPTAHIIEEKEPTIKEREATSILEDIQIGAFISALIKEFSEISIRKDPHGDISVKYEGKDLCTFSISTQEVHYSKDAFNNVSTAKKVDVERRFKEIMEHIEQKKKGTTKRKARKRPQLGKEPKLQTSSTETEKDKAEDIRKLLEKAEEKKKKETLEGKRKKEKTEEEKKEIGKRVAEVSPLKDQIVGVSIMYWDPRAGPQNLDKYPPEYDIGMPQFMQVYSNYQANKKQRFYSFGDLEKTIYTYRRSGDDEPFLILETTLEGKEDYIEHTLKEYSTKIGVNGLELSDDSRTADQIFHSLQS